MDEIGLIGQGDGWCRRPEILGGGYGLLVYDVSAFCIEKAKDLGASVAVYKLSGEGGDRKTERRLVTHVVSEGTGRDCPAGRCDRHPGEERGAFAFHGAEGRKTE